MFTLTEDELLELAAEGKAFVVLCHWKTQALLSSMESQRLPALLFEPLAAEDIDPLTGELPLY